MRIYHQNDQGFRCANYRILYLFYLKLVCSQLLLGQNIFMSDCCQKFSYFLLFSLVKFAIYLCRLLKFHRSVWSQ
jgi:hypothetical protein